ncbi:dockerin type I domain-containing protein [Neorhodopirellula pilleata]|uniref:Dockerin type I repeat protein n=1 Tax=Neorhodopirellula pilleata TaxID=2714738 RepID=A0A5C6ACK6_9BACT|nr:dockerin type I domain-containing protein [Neorhodopirellula pilleata]TWT97127.1 Dockerin type I repeat protein [Neorhodopirellula pilleata]
MKLPDSLGRLLNSRYTAKPRRAIRERSMRLEKLDARAMLAADFGMGASALAMDVNADGAVSASDALSVINHLVRSESQRGDGVVGDSLRDTNRDGRISSIDALLVINHLNRHGGGTIQLRELVGPRGDRISDAQKDNIRQLMGDLNSIRAESEVTPEQITQLLGDLATVAADATRPSEESVSQLIESAQAAAEDGKFTPVELAGLTADVQAVLESANISPKDAQSVADSVRSIVQASGVDQEDVQIIAADLNAIFAEFQNREPVVSETQRENIRILVSDITAIRSESEVTPEQIEELRSSLFDLAEGATRPDRSLKLQLLRDTRAARSDGEISDADREQLASGVDAVLESANIPQAERDAVLEDIQSIVDASGIAQEDIQTIAEDVNAIRTEFWNNHDRPRDRIVRPTRR